MCLAQRHNAVAPVRLEPKDTRSRVKHSTTTVNLNLSILKICYYTKWKKSSCYFFCKNVFIFNFRKFVNGKAVEETFSQPLQKIWCLLHMQILCTVKPQKFELRIFCNSLNSSKISKSFWLTGKIRMGVTERGIIQNKNRERWKSCYSKVVYNMKGIKLPFACSEFSVHAQNQRKTGSFVRTKFGFLHNVPFFCMCSIPLA